MQKSKSHSLKLKLTSLIVMLLSPQKPFLNETIALDDYIKKLVDQNEESNFLFISQVASNNKSILESLIAQKTVESQIQKLLIDGNSNSAQFIYNLSKQRLFIENYHSSLTMDLYRLLQQKVKTLDADILSILLLILTSLALHSSSQTERLANQIKEDLQNTASNDIVFTQKIILPLL